MGDHLQNPYDRSFPGCMKGLGHFLDLHHHIHLKKMKMLTYRKHGEGKRAPPRHKEPKTDSDAPSTTQEYISNEDDCFEVEDRVNETRKHSSMRIPFPKWRLREHNKKKMKASPPLSRLLRTSSIHHMKNDSHLDNVDCFIDTPIVEQIEEERKASSIDEKGYTLRNTNDDRNLKNQCGENMNCDKSVEDGELESLLHKVASFAQKDSNVKDLQGDVILYPSKEFLDMMKLFNGNIELIQKILEDPSFIFAHYLQGQRACNTPLRKNYSFPTLGKIERTTGGSFEIKHKRFESEFLCNFHSENSHSDPDIVRDDVSKADDSVSPSSISQKTMKCRSSISHFKLMKDRIKDIIKDNKKEHHNHNHISMDGILHRVPYGRKVPKDISKIKPDQGNGFVADNVAREIWRNKSGKHFEKSIERSRSLNECLSQYSHLYESITKGEFKGLPERQKSVKTSAKILGRMFSLSNIRYSLSSKIVRMEDHLRPSSPNNLITLENEESKKFTTKESLKMPLIDCENIPSPTNEQCEFSNEFTTGILIRDDINAISLQVQKQIEEEAYIYELSKEYIDDDSQGSKLKYQTEDGYESNEKSSFLFHRIDRNHESEFNYVREILKRSGFIGNDFLGAWHNPYQPMNPSVFTEAEGLDYEPDIGEDEHENILKHQLLFDMTNEALVEMYEDSFSYYFPWLSHFSANIRPVPVGNHILEEVWGDIYWHLESQSRFDKNLDEIVSRDFVRNDGWMKIQYDIEDVEFEVECFILDDLLDELVLQFSALTGFESIPL